MKKLKVQDLILIGVYAAMYFLIVSVATMLARFTIPIYNSLLIPSVSALISGTLYLIVINKVPKFGAITLVGAIMAIFFFAFGYFPLAFLPSILFPLLADLIQYKSKFPRQLKSYLSYTIFSFGLTGPILPLWFMKDAYVSSLLERGKDMTYVQSVFEPVTSVSFIVSMLLVVVTSLIGLKIGYSIYNKHFLRKK